MSEEMPVKVGRPRKDENYIPVPQRKVIKLKVSGPFGVGRPKRTEIRPAASNPRPVGRPRTGKAPGASFSLGRDYIERLDELSDQLQMAKSAIIRDCVNRLALRFGFPQASFDYEEQSYRPSAGSFGDDAYFSLGENHKALLERMRKVRDDANDGKPAERRRMGGTTQLLREEIDRFAVEHGLEPIKPLTEQVMAV